MAKNIDKIFNEEDEMRESEKHDEKMLGYINNILASLNYLKRENKADNKGLIEFWENQAEKYRRV
jgi:hypothetical protein